MNKIRLLKRTNKFFQVFKKGQQNNIQRHDKFSSISCMLHLTQSCANSAQQCAEFGTSAWEGIRHSGWEFSILATRLEKIHPLQRMHQQIHGAKILVQLQLCQNQYGKFPSTMSDASHADTHNYSENQNILLTFS